MFGYTVEEERAFHTCIAHGMLICSVATFVILYFFLHSPFGKHAPMEKEKWWLGPPLPARASWFFFESPNLIWSVVCYSQRNRDVFGTPHAILWSCFVLHYINRAIAYPLRMKQSKPVPFLVAFSATTFCTFNGYLQSQGLCQFQEFPSPDYIYSLPFLSGLALFACGIGMNQQSDATLRNLRRVPGEYKIPRGGMFEYVSGAHYLGELLEWLGFCVAMNGSLQGVAFFAYTASNLIPRAVSHHAWYHEQFRDAYPKERKAIIPFLW
mmetsp:Transcript_22786/g.37742  ORF Transcript_22786/g.37742 Transcript_22786/m.37742 type:complete len:267 (+) Transcript_22786:73-873(+)|eukprot:CAMPEP_0119005482 /NCGR_PEP_ID=MMETSP1176-20130426/1749_1 /TAXON_ID=265551 /ORGANISM="Synedropsis recta cf, Strain CCMP1620" /LENGTH=266 /DNA_ID=CAMNT_0006957295 /DNA_START=44 /DNA_END=844 /DNA_ORIENTATION=+